MDLERKLLIVVFTCMRFHTYLYDRSFTIQTYPKSLEIITMKNLTSGSLRLQLMLFYLQVYDLVLKYSPGKEMLLADILLHFPSWKEYIDPT